VRARIAASVVLAAGLLLGTSGCTFFAPQSTLLRYDPSDGVGSAIGNVKVRNALMLTKDGQRASLLVSFINDGTSDVDLTVQYTVTPGGKKTTVVHLEAGEAKTFGDKDTDQLILQGIGRKAGELFPVYFQYGSHTGQQLLVPILDGTWSAYAGLLPTAKPSPTSTVLPRPVLPPPVTGAATASPTPPH